MMTGNFKGIGLDHRRVYMDIAEKKADRSARVAERYKRMKAVNDSIEFAPVPKPTKRRKRKLSSKKVSRVEPTKRVHARQKRTSGRTATSRIEFIVSKRVVHLLRLKDNTPETDRTLLTMKKKLQKGQLTMKYTRAKDAVGGRFFAETGFTTLPGFAKRLFLNNSDHDVNIVNCGPTLFIQAVTKHLGTDWNKRNMPKFRRCVKKRQVVTATLHHEYGVTREKIKSGVIIAINCGFASIPFTKSIKQESSVANRELMAVPELRKYRDIAEERHEETESSPS